MVTDTAPNSFFRDERKGMYAISVVGDVTHLRFQEFKKHGHPILEYVGRIGDPADFGTTNCLFEKFVEALKIKNIQYNKCDIVIAEMWEVTDDGEKIDVYKEFDKRTKVESLAE